MPRPRRHNPDKVRQGLVAAFLRHGFEGATFSDLAEATGLDRGQLSRDYGDKRQLFLIALEEMNTLTSAARLDGLRESGDGTNIRALLLEICDQANSEQGRLGCLMCNSCREPILLEDPEVASVLQDHLRRVESAYRAALSRSIETASFGTSPAETRRAGRMLLGVHVGLMVLLRAGEPRAVLRDLAEGTLDSLGI